MICFAICGILFEIELVEDKDTPRERCESEFEILGKTVELLLSTGKFYMLLKSSRSIGFFPGQTYLQSKLA